ncbi:hypothetical protein NMK43_08845 [Bacillus licheniformis]|uniref:hypothetical protein n=1 Tax=Bacillus licheniformis TaxID=1402 RepID=UPI0020C8D0A1|nr:hypothetical protein [Bacillus licheniformis]MCP8973201.1 hypothetical protein [Bacillus licheniformis]
MKPKKLKELLTFSIVHRAHNLSEVKKEQLETGLMKLNTEELEILDDIVTDLTELSKPTRRRKTEDSDVEDDT